MDEIRSESWGRSELLLLCHNKIPLRSDFYAPYFSCGAPIGWIRFEATVPFQNRVIYRAVELIPLATGIPLDAVVRSVCSFTTRVGA